MPRSDLFLNISIDRRRFSMSNRRLHFIFINSFHGLGRVSLPRSSSRSAHPLEQRQSAGAGGRFAPAQPTGASVDGAFRVQYWDREEPPTAWDR